MDKVRNLRVVIQVVRPGSGTWSCPTFRLVYCEQLTRLNQLIIDELGFAPLSHTGAELLFEVFSQRYERGSILVTTNLPFDDWTGVFGSERFIGALLDMRTRHVHIL